MCSRAVASVQTETIGIRESIEYRKREVLFREKISLWGKGRALVGQRFVCTVSLV